MCNSKIYDYLIGIITVIAGIAGGVLFSRGTLTGLTELLPYFAVISAVIFAVTAVLVLLPKCKEKALTKCLCSYAKIILFFSIASIVTALFILTITLAATSILSITLVGISFATLAGNITAFLFLFYCVIDTKCNKNNCCCCSIQQTNTNNSCNFNLE